MTWKELKEFANSLDDKWLNKRVIVWHEDSVTVSIKAMELEEDHYMGDGDEYGCYPLSEAGMTVKEAKEKGISKVYDKGHPILWEKF